MIFFIVTLVGFFSVFSQSIFIREVLMVFYGNELISGILLSSWLFFGGIGSIFMGKISYKIKRGLRLFTLLIIIFSLLSILEFFLIKSLRILFGFRPGEIPSPLFVFLISFFILSPFSFVNGFLFTLAIKIYTERKKEKAIAYVYAWDALGDMLGGLVFSFIFIYFFDPLENILLVNLILISFYYFFLACLKRREKFLLFFLIFIIFLIPFAKRADTFLTKKVWRGFKIVEKSSSFYADLVLTKRRNLYSLYANGILDFSFPLRRDDEGLVSLVFLQLKRPQNVLVIGAGIKGIISQILKYKVKKVYYLELDPKLIKMVKKYLPEQDRKALVSRKVKVIHKEARDFINTYKGEKFDVIFLNTSLPLNLYLNRFYTVEFFQKIRTLLKSEGVFTLSIPSKENYLSQELQDLDACIFHTLKKVFPKIILVPGEELRFLASLRGALSDDPQELASRFSSRKISLEYINRYYFYTKFIPWHIDYIRNILEKHKPRINYDFEPIAYLYGINYLNSYFKSNMNRLFSWLSHLKFYYFFILISSIFFFAFIFRKKFIAPLSTIGVGAAGISCVILSILGFQIIYGYVYYKIGLINALFMLGVAMGSNFSSLLRNRAFLSLIFSLLIFSLLFFFLPYFFKFLSSKTSFLSFIIFFISFWGGGLVGVFFPLINYFYLREKNSQKELTKEAGFLYACDLIGGALGGIILSVVFLPLYGIIKSCNFIGVILAEAAIFLYFSLKR